LGSNRLRLREKEDNRRGIKRRLRKERNKGLKELKKKGSKKRIGA